MFKNIEGNDKMKVRAIQLMGDALVAKTEAGLLEPSDYELMQELPRLAEYVETKTYSRAGDVDEGVLDWEELTGIDSKKLAWEV